jgi:predicted transcriptional regulator
VAVIQKVVKDVFISRMRDEGISRAELARRLKVSRAAVTQMFSEERWTLDRTEQIANALGFNLRIGLRLKR